MQVVVRQGHDREVRLEVGVLDDFPPLVAERLLRPALQAVPGLRIVCRRGAKKPLLAALAAHECDMLLANEPLAPHVRGKAFDHPLGECGTTFFAAERLASLGSGFPGSLDGAPALLPVAPSPMRAALDDWFRAKRVKPVVLGEFDDAALLRAFAARGFAFFAGASIVESEIARTVGVNVLGRTDEVRVRFVATTVDRRIGHPGVSAIVEAAGLRPA
jgi:LysR family transcriptional activator of nhaA